MIQEKIALITHFSALKFGKFKGEVNLWAENYMGLKPLKIVDKQPKKNNYEKLNLQLSAMLTCYGCGSSVCWLRQVGR